jgi:hypothetical protein
VQPGLTDISNRVLHVSASRPVSWPTGRRAVLRNPEVNIWKQASAVKGTGRLTFGVP